MTPNNKDTENLTEQQEGGIKTEQISPYPFMKSLICCRKYGLSFDFYGCHEKAT